MRNKHDHKNNYPIAIVGGGMVGLTLAIALKSKGIDNVVLEAFPLLSETQPSFDDRTVALSAASLDIFRNLNLDKQLSNYYQPIEKIHVSDKGHYGFTRLKASELAVERLGAVIENWRLGQVLHERINNLGIDLIAPAKVENISFSTDSAKITFETNGDKKTIDSKLVILADGSRSALKECLHFESEVVDYEKSAIVCNVKTQLSHNNEAFERFTKDGPFALLPLSDQRMSLVWSVPNESVDHYLNCSEKEFSDSLVKIFGNRLGRFIKIGQRQSFPLQQWQSHNLIKQRCMLIGNSAQALHPIAGQGFNLALRDILAFVKNIEPEDSTFDFGDYPFLKNFVEQRRQDRNNTVKSTESLVRLFSNDFLHAAFLRNLSMKVIDRLPFLKKRFAQTAMGYREGTNEEL